MRGGQRPVVWQTEVAIRLTLETSPLYFAEGYATGFVNGSTKFTRGELGCFAALTMTIRNHLSQTFTSVAPTALSADKGPRSKGARR
jgi:hypothetical protein